MVAEVNVLYPQAQTFHEAQAAAIEDFGHQAGSAAHFINDRQGFGMDQNSGQDLRAGGAHQYGGQVDLFLQDDAVQEEQRAKRLVLGGGGNLAFGCEVGDESLYPSTGSGQRFLRAHVLWVALLVEEDVALDPIHAEGLLGRFVRCGRSSPARGCYAMLGA